MDAMNAILTRRSIRRYTDKPVSDGTIKELLKAGMAAPSANNKQPWHFVVVRDKNIMNKIMEVHPYSKMLKEAPVVISVCANAENYGDTAYWVEDLSAATENILVAANALGLGAVWLGVYPSKDRPEQIKNILGLPDGMLPLNLISIGYPAEGKSSSNRFDESRIHYEKW